MIPPFQWAVLQIQEPTKPPVMLTLKTGGSEGAFELLAVDAQARRVKIRHAGLEMSVALEDEDSPRKTALAKLEVEHRAIPTMPLLGAGDP